MKSRNSGGIDGVGSEMVKSGGEIVVELIKKMCEAAWNMVMCLMINFLFGKN